MRRIGFIVNPYAGMGGAVGLKGTDGCVKEAQDRGALPVSPSRALRFLTRLERRDLVFLTAGGNMGEDELKEAGISSYQVVYMPSSTHTDSEDTCEACRSLIRAGVEIIFFCGGDGTARDVFSVIGQSRPILGIPSGVKIYSGVFATTPDTAAETLTRWESARLSFAEVLDVDEEQYRAGVLTTRIFGIAQIPYIPELCQSGKQADFGDETFVYADIARFIRSIMCNDTIYLLGAGSTTGAISDCMHLPYTLLGVDAVYQGRLIASDLNEQGILDLLNIYEKVKIIVSPIGAQGFVLGRGNQQISSKVLEKTGIDALIVVATPAKLQQTPVLYVDTGDEKMNLCFDSTILVICGYAMAQRKPLNH
ncbi:MAG: ATP-NAD kinase [Methanomicrobiales archaeon HGW-Methanomicrobiales-4]|nr:MAG: ATP-NAD kinase [Methanomicrobiales archaeon HGW-Methanomicrobiales-4]